MEIWCGNGEFSHGEVVVIVPSCGMKVGDWMSWCGSDVDCEAERQLVCLALNGSGETWMNGEWWIERQEVDWALE